MLQSGAGRPWDRAVRVRDNDGLEKVWDSSPIIQEC